MTKNEIMELVYQRVDQELPLKEEVTSNICIIINDIKRNKKNFKKSISLESEWRASYLGHSMIEPLKTNRQ